MLSVTLRYFRAQIHGLLLVVRALCIAGRRSRDCFFAIRSFFFCELLKSHGITTHEVHFKSRLQKRLSRGHHCWWDHVGSRRAVFF